jgi:pre-mRNA-splicing factor CDC5/CEF1
VLPEPQISDREIEQIVKVGRASDSIREIADTGENTSTATLLTEYNFTPVATGGPLAARTPMRTPAHSVDVIAQVRFVTF